MPGPDRDDVLAALAGRFADFYSQHTPLKPSGGELRGPCPVHGGSGLNFAVDARSGLWFCHSGCQSLTGKGGGDVFDFLMRKEGLTFPEALERVADFAGVSASGPRASHPVATPSAPKSPPPKPPPPLDPCLAEDLHRRLMHCPPMIAWLERERGLTNGTLERFRVGLHRDDRDQGFYRVTFPVFDRRGRLMDVRRHLFAYRPDLTEERRRGLGKTKSWRGSGNWLGLFPLAALDDAAEALIVEGEADAALACQLGFAAVTGTAGAGTWKEHWTEELRDLSQHGLARVTILYDDDPAGQEGARRVAAAVATAVQDVRIACYDLKARAQTVNAPKR